MEVYRTQFGAGWGDVVDAIYDYSRSELSESYPLRGRLSSSRNVFAILDLRMTSENCHSINQN